MEPIRRILGTKGAYYEAECQEIIPEEKTVVACFPKDAGFPAACFKVPYDYLVVGEGLGEHGSLHQRVEGVGKWPGRAGASRIGSSHGRSLQSTQCPAKQLARGLHVHALADHAN